MFISQVNPLYSVYFAPRGFVRMTSLGAQIAQQHLTAFDRLIGIIGEAGSGKSLIIKGMFPGLELTNDDDGVNVRPLPLLDVDEDGFYQPHTYHLDIRFESAFTQMHVLADAIKTAVDKGRRVVVEHFDLIYPAIGINAELLVGIGEEVIVTRPTIFGPEPDDLSEIVVKSNKYRRMAHSAEDLTEFYLHKRLPASVEYAHGDVRHGFLLKFNEKPDINLEELEAFVRDLIQQDLPISYMDDMHIKIGEYVHKCTGPRMHATRTGKIENFHVLKELHHDVLSNQYIMVGLVGNDAVENIRDINSIKMST